MRGVVLTVVVLLVLVLVRAFVVLFVVFFVVVVVVVVVVLVVLVVARVDEVGRAGSVVEVDVGDPLVARFVVFADALVDGVVKPVVVDVVELVDGLVVGVVVEVVVALELVGPPTVVVVDELGELEGAVGTGPGGNSGSVVTVVLGSAGGPGTVVADGKVVTVEALVSPVVVVDGDVVVVVDVVVVDDGTVVTEVTDVTGGSVVALSAGRLTDVVVVGLGGAAPAVAAREAALSKAPAMTSPAMAPLLAATRRVSPLIEICEETGNPGTYVP